MTQLTDAERRRAFGYWMRTGQLPEVRGPDGIELKFNPWHDPDDGRFTFAGTGRHFAGGMRGWSQRDRSASAGSSRPGAHKAAAPLSSPPDASNRRDTTSRRAVDVRRSPGSWSAGGFTGGGGGRFGGAGATGSGDWPNPAEIARSRSRLSSTIPRAASHAGLALRPAIRPATPFREIERDGYVYAIDDRGRTRRVSGVLTLTSTPSRSRSAQARAGGADRRATDDGGHYVAARFNGPTEAFNHFAQDASFNRGRYRRLENGWGAAKRAGKHVIVTIIPRLDGPSARPSEIDVRYTIDGIEGSDKFPNEKQEKRRGK